MPEERTNLELLILALLKRGLATAYDLLTQAEISVGATLPAFKRLKKAGLVEAAAGSRRSQRYVLTAAGEKALAAGGRQIARKVPRDFEGVLRVAYLLWLTGRLRPAQEFLRRAAKERTGLAQEAKAKAEALAGAREKFIQGYGHKWLRSFSAAALRKAEAQTLRQLATQLRTLPR